MLVSGVPAGALRVRRRLVARWCRHQVAFPCRGFSGPLVEQAETQHASSIKKKPRPCRATANFAGHLPGSGAALLTVRAFCRYGKLLRRQGTRKRKGVEEQHVQAAQEHSIDMEEICTRMIWAGEDRARWPGTTPPSWQLQDWLTSPAAPAPEAPSTSVSGDANASNLPVGPGIV